MCDDETAAGNAMASLPEWALALEAWGLDERALLAGLACFFVQCVAWIIFRYALPDGPWRAEPGFTAHQLVALPLMVTFTYLGMHGWFFEPTPPTAAARILGTHATGRLLTQLVIGELLFWDTPTGFTVKTLRDPLMLVHHIAMLLVAMAGQTTYSYYGCCFFGVIELSGIPLVVVDLFHPKHKQWTQLAHSNSAIEAVNNGARALFAALYMLVRAFYFPYVVFTQVLPDAWAVYSLPAAERASASTFALLFIPTFGVLFSLLQWYWASLIARQVAKLLAPDHKPKHQ